MAAPFWKADPRVWSIAVAPWVDGSTPWPRELVIEDLRWWADQVEMGREVLPGRPTLARRWSWTDWAVKGVLREADPLRRQPTASAPPADRQRSASAPPAEERADANKHVDSASAPPALRQPTASAPPADRHARVVDRADRATEQTDVHEPPADPPPAIREPVLVSPVDRPPVVDDWTQLAEHYGHLPGCMKPRDRKTGNGEHLTTILRKAGSLAVAVNLLEWWMYAPGARQLRTGSHDGSESDAAPVYGLKTLARPKNTDGYLEQAASWARQRNPPRRKLSTAAAERPSGRAPPIVETPDHVIKPVRLQPLPPPLKPRKP